jgi:transposase
MGIGRNTIRRYLEGAEPGLRKPSPRPRPVFDRVRPRLEELLEESPRWTGGKQRLTATQLWRLLREEKLEVGLTLVKAYFAEWKRQRREVFVPLCYKPGDLGQVDFFEVLVDVAGKRQKAWLFLLRPMYSGRDFAWLYPRQDQVCFLDGHVRAFEFYGGVWRRLVYDNLKPAVSRVFVGSERELTRRFLALASHYVFEPCFARPATGHDKGGVEARGRAVRLQHLVPIPSGPDLETISGELMRRLEQQAVEKRGRQGRTVAERFTDERPHLLPLPAHAFTPAATRLVSVGRRSLCQVMGGYYSVPETWAGLTVTAHVGVADVELVGPDGRARHRRVRFGERAIDYRHFVRTLSQKPQAIRQVADELVRDLGEPFGAAWRRLVQDHGPREAARVFAQVLRVLVEVGEWEIRQRIARALASGEPLLLALRAPMPPEPALARESLPRDLAAIEVATTRAAEYDAWLGAAS